MLRKSLLAAIAASSLALFASSSFAQVVEGVDAKTVQTLKGNFEKQVGMPAKMIDYIGKTDYPGLFLIMAQGYSNSFYSDITFNKMIVGSYIDNQRAHANISNELKDKNFKIMPAKFNLKNAITDKQGTGARKIYVVADVNCFYCKKLETEVLSKIQNVTVYTIPVTFLKTTPETEKKVRTLLCKPESEQNKRWVDVMLTGNGEIGKEDCAKAGTINENTELAKNLGISGTPTIIFDNGSVHVGAIELNDLEAKLAKNAPAK